MYVYFRSKQFQKKKEKDSELLRSRIFTVNVCQFPTAPQVFAVERPHHTPDAWEIDLPQKATSTRAKLKWELIQEQKRLCTSTKSMSKGCQRNSISPCLTPSAHSHKLILKSVASKYDWPGRIYLTRYWNMTEYEIQQDVLIRLAREKSNNQW